MSSELQPVKKPRPRPPARTSVVVEPPAPSIEMRLFDALLILVFLGLTFLLGAFPLKDTDFWWHLRAGDLIRKTGTIPDRDLFTFMAEGRPWIDLHWVYQVAISWIHEHGGVPGLTLVKCGLTTLAVFLLITARRRDWPVWAMLVAWLPALLVLGGRMYVRPETMSLFYLSIYLAVLSRIDRAPALAFVLPFVQAAWVNTQGLFVLGPFVLGCALIDAVLRPGSFAPGKKRWWMLIASATLLTGLACLVNPYTIRGALYPLELARTMRNPIFSRWIAELTPIPEFIKRDGFISVPLRIQFITLILGALSFLAPMVWAMASRLRPVPAQPAPAATRKPREGKDRPRKKKPQEVVVPRAARGWHVSLFRLLLFGAFSVLSMQATRNSHQFAAVAGTITAWNVGEWVAAMRRRGAATVSENSPLNTRREVFPRLAALAILVTTTVWVGSGWYYQLCGEGRVIGLDEEPLWYPHEAVKLSADPGMPRRSLAYHIGHASLYDYYFGPEHKVYADARLEVIGADLFERYLDLSHRIGEHGQGWEAELDAVGRPSILAGHEGHAAVSAGLIASPNWRCVWFDPIAAVFVHVSATEAVEKHGIDFAARHFHPDPATQPRGIPAILASTKGLRNIVASLGRVAPPDKARPLLLLAMNLARRLKTLDPLSNEGWKQLGLLELMREPPTSQSGEPIPRFRMAFDPVFDLSSLRVTYYLNRALDTRPDDFMTLFTLIEAYKQRSMNEAALPLIDRLINLPPINGLQMEQQTIARPLRASVRTALGIVPALKWDNVSELNQLVNGLLAAGRAETAAEVLERAAPPEARTWEEADRIATLRMHLGQPDQARAAWRAVADPPRPALRDARVGCSYLVQESFDAAREAFRAAINADPNLFEAPYGLAILEQDAGRAAEALAAARRAVAIAPNDIARSAAQGIIATVTPYATSPLARDVP